jgi:uncharacterized membrane protein HdeD (DUF308 family)
MNLAWLLLGPGNLRRSRGWLVVMGALLLAAGLAIVIDASDTVTALTLEACGWLLVALGLFKLALTVLASGGGTPSLFGVQGVIFTVFGLAVAEFPGTSENAVPWLFGLAFLLNGTYQLVSALIIRYPNWLWFLVSGAAHLVLGGLMFLEWKLAMHWVVPLLLGAGLAVFGLSTLRTALRLGPYLPGEEGWVPERAVRWYMDFHMPRRFRQHYFPGPIQPPPETGAPHGELLVHIWTPITVSRVEQDPNLVSRYVVARDQEGKFTVGHAALEMAPDVYVSHCDGDPNAFDDTDEVWRTLRARDVHGEFLPGFKEEVEHYMEPSVTVRFRNFREDQLRTFWAVYRQVTTYNFTNRNCSVAVALALEAALMGSMGGGRRFRALVGLLLSRDLWMAHFIRWKAREMVWTPGIMLDYAIALQRVAEG